MKVSMSIPGYSLWRLLANDRGEGDAGAAAGNAGDPQAGAAGGAGAGAGGDWREPFMADDKLKPIVEKMGEFKSVGDVLKSYDWTKQQLGKAVFLKDPSNGDEKKAAQARAYELGIFDKPNIPEAPEKYELKLDAIPEQMRSADTVKAAQAWAHKHGVSVDAMNELMALEAKRFTDVVKPALDIAKAEANKEFERWARDDVGKSAQELMAYGGQWLAKNLSDDEMRAVELSGLGNHPAIIKMIARAGLDSGEDISTVVGSQNSVDSQVETDYAEAVKIRTDPSHPDHLKFAKGDPAVVARVDAAYKKKFGAGEG